MAVTSDRASGAGAVASCPSLGLLALGPVPRRLPGPARPAGRAELLASFYEALGNTAGATDLRAGGGDQVARQAPPRGVALAVGVGGIWLFYVGLNALVERARDRWRDRLLPWVFVGPALRCWPSTSSGRPSARSSRASIDARAQSRSRNYERADRPGSSSTILRNNVIWLVVGTAAPWGSASSSPDSFDRVRRESLAKTFIFLPLAISLVGASVIWRFVYAWQPGGQPQYGLLNAIWTALGGEPVPWVTDHAHQHVRRDRHPHLAPDGLRHGRPVGGHQGRAGGDHRGGPPRRRHRAPAVPPDHRAA